MKELLSWPFWIGALFGMLVLGKLIAAVRAKLSPA